MIHVHDDGGREAAGYKGSARDCVARSIAIATGKPYGEVYDALAAGMKARTRKGTGSGKASARNGVFRDVYQPYLESLGWTWTPTMKVGQGTTVHLRADELPSGTLIVKVSRHLTAVIDGVIHDDHDPSRGGSRAVYGFFSKAAA